MGQGNRSDQTVSTPPWGIYIFIYKQKRERKERWVLVKARVDQSAETQKSGVSNKHEKEDPALPPMNQPPFLVRKNKWGKPEKDYKKKGSPNNLHQTPMNTHLSRD
jgi:hypothetical protein